MCFLNKSVGYSQKQQLNQTEYHCDKNQKTPALTFLLQVAAKSGNTDNTRWHQSWNMLAVRKQQVYLT